MNPSGGLVYHYSAFRHRKFTWKNYRENVESWLLSWPQRQGSLLLIGPSAGYSLSSLFLSQYEEVTAIDPDPMAQYLFKKNHSLKNLNWQRRDAFNSPNLKWNPEGLQKTLDDFPNHNILFCNVLGQLPLIFPELTHSHVWSAWQKSFQAALKGRKWASYHDLYSFPMKFRHLDLDIIKKWERDQDTEDTQYLEKLLAHLPRTKSWSIADHCTKNLFPIGRRRLFAWQRLPNALHIVEARRNS